MIAARSLAPLSAEGPYRPPRLARASGEATWFMLAIRSVLSVLMWLWLLRVDLRDGR